MKKTQKGFSLIESLMAIFILSIGILASVNLFSQSATQSVSTGKNVTALGLAQEGVELMRVLRNDDIVKGNVDFTTIDAKALPYNAANERNTCRIMASVSGSKLGVDGDCSGGSLGYTLRVPSSAPALYPYYAYPNSFNSNYPVFWRRLYIQKITVNGIPDSARRVVSVVYFKDPGSNWPPSLANIKSVCTTAVGCVYAEAVLQ